MRALERFVREVQQHLEADLPARLDALNDVDGVVIELPHPKEYAIGGANDISPNMTPILEIAIADWGIQHFSLGQTMADLDFPLIVRFWNTHADFETLYLTNLRYSSAIVDSLIQPTAVTPSDSPVVDVSTVRGALRVNPETGEREEFMSGGLVVIGGETTETRSP